MEFDEVLTISIEAPLLKLTGRKDFHMHRSVTRDCSYLTEVTKVMRSVLEV
ncbi:uncharacterized protein G2W53_015694 [Senna tora]|uniref:Uncharacterized protein n=1 Tax=Senna tora TaxID=362788 RepID=A0A834WVP3_9FABA|nr:uncharacterized protein G2W53_015694 [Senna tora]